MFQVCTKITSYEQPRFLNMKAKLSLSFFFFQWSLLAQKTNKQRKKQTKRNKQRKKQTKQIAVYRLNRTEQNRTEQNRTKQKQCISCSLYSVLNTFLRFMMKHWLTNTHQIKIVKKSGPIEKRTPGLLMSSQELCHCTTQDHSGLKGNLD